MKVVFTNPSEFEVKKEDVRSYLPTEIKKVDIVDTGELELDHDPSMARFFVHKYLELEPKEERTYKVLVRDVWKIPVEEIQFVRNQADIHLHAMDGKEDYEQVKLLHEKIINELKDIEDSQASQIGDVQKRLESYRVNRERLRGLRANIILLKDFKLEAESESDTLKVGREIHFVIKLVNPSEVEEKTEEVVRYLPEGVTPDTMIDTKGFDLRFDPDKRLFFLAKKIVLKPLERKEIVIRLTDRWRVPEPKLESFTSKADEITAYLSSSEFKDAANYLNSEIGRYVQEIKETQASMVGIKDRISNYNVNLKKVEAIRLNLQELERMRQIIMERQRENLLKELLKKMSPDVLTTWRIIYGTITFLGLISILTYFLWWGQAKSKLNRTYEDLTEGAPPMEEKGK